MKKCSQMDEVSCRYGSERYRATVVVCFLARSRTPPSTPLLIMMEWFYAMKREDDAMQHQHVARGGWCDRSLALPTISICFTSVYFVLYDLFLSLSLSVGLQSREIDFFD